MGKNKNWSYRVIGCILLCPSLKGWLKLIFSPLIVLEVLLVLILIILLLSFLLVVVVIKLLAVVFVPTPTLLSLRSLLPHIFWLSAEKLFEEVFGIPIVLIVLFTVLGPVMGVSRFLLFSLLLLLLLRLGFPHLLIFLALSFLLLVKGTERVFSKTLVEALVAKAPSKVLIPRRLPSLFLVWLPIAIALASPLLRPTLLGILTHIVILLAFLSITNDIICCSDIFEPLLSFALILIWMILLSQLIISRLDFFFWCSRRNS